MRTVAVAVKTLKEAVRQPRLLAITMGLPLVFMVIFGLAFGGDNANETFVVAAQDDDGSSLSRAFLDGLGDLAYDDGRPVVEVRAMPAEEARAALEARRIDAFLVVPRGFGDGLTPRAQPGGTPLQPTQVAPPSGASVRVTGDPSFPDFVVVSRVVESYAQRFGEEATRQPPPVRVDQESVTSRELVQFDFIAPGLMVFAILGLIPQAASALAREVELGTIDRLRQSPTGALRVLGGVALAQMVIAAVSLALMLLSAHVMGFHNQGSWLSAYAIAMLAAFAAIGIGMVVASFARSQQEGASIGTLVAVPASFLSGAFFDVPGVEIFAWGERVVTLYHVLPSTWAVEALRQVLTFGRPLGDAAGSLAAIAVLSGLFLLAGAALYRRTRLAPA